MTSMTISMPFKSLQHARRHSTHFHVRMSTILGWVRGLSGLLGAGRLTMLARNRKFLY
jgi:hypothetical protein